MLPFRKIINVIVSTFRPPTTIIWVNACFVGHRYSTFKSLSATYDTPCISTRSNGAYYKILEKKNIVTRFTTEKKISQILPTPKDKLPLF
jgi:hypothetical protein